MPTARVPNFLPSMSGFHFPNSFNAPGISDLVTQALPFFGNIGLGTPGNGLCGGFVFSAIDFFNAQPRVLMLPNMAIPNAPSSNPANPGDPLFNYLFERLLDTFVLGQVGVKTLLWLALPTHDTSLSGFLAPHGLAWLMVNEEWPLIQADLDSGMLSPLGLVGDNVSACHQVLAHGYDLDGQGNLTIYCYDPNEPSQDGAATLSLNISQSYHTIPITSANISNVASDPPFRGIFHSAYSNIHAAGILVGPLGIGQVPPSAQALQPLAPGWSAWDSPFSLLLFEGGLTIQDPASYANAPISVPYPPLTLNPASSVSVCSWGPNRMDLFIQDQIGFADHLSWQAGMVGLDQLQQSVVSCPCSVSWGNGRVDAFAVLNGLDYSLVHMWFDGGQLQTSESLGRPLGNWDTVPIPLDGSDNSAIRISMSTGLFFATPPCVCTWAPGRLDVFAFANRAFQPTSTVPTVDANLVHLTFDSNWQPWRAVPLPGGITVDEGSGPVATSWGEGRIDLFFMDTSGNLRHCAYTARAGSSSSWSAWDNLGAPPAGFNKVQPCVVSWGTGRLDVFIRGSDQNLYHQWYDASSGPTAWADAWENLGCPAGGLQGTPTACSWSQGRLDIFARGNDVDVDSNPVPALWHLWFDGTWHRWESLGAVIQSDPVAISWGNNQIDVFAPGGNIFTLGSQDFVPWHVSFQG